MATARPAAEPAGVQVCEVFQDGTAVAVLMAIDHGDTFTVVTEVFDRSPEGADAVQRRPYTFTDAAAGQAFLAEAMTAFTYLGCEVRQR
jgi:hypothetical protein